MIFEFYLYTRIDKDQIRILSQSVNDVKYINK